MLHILFDLDWLTPDKLKINEPISAELNNNIWMLGNVEVFVPLCTWNKVFPCNRPTPPPKKKKKKHIHKKKKI